LADPPATGSLLATGEVFGKTPPTYAPVEQSAEQMALEHLGGLIENPGAEGRRMVQQLRSFGASDDIITMTLPSMMAEKAARLQSGQFQADARSKARLRTAIAAETPEGKKYKKEFIEAKVGAVVPKVPQLAPQMPQATAPGFPTLGAKWTPELLEQQPHMGLVDPDTNKLLPGAYHSLMGRFTEGGTARIGETQFERTGEYFEDAPEAVRRHLKAREGKFREEEVYAPRAKKIAELTEKYRAGETVTLPGRLTEEPEMPGEMAMLEEIGGIQRAGIAIPEAALGAVYELVDALSADDPDKFFKELAVAITKQPEMLMNFTRNVVKAPEVLVESIAGMAGDVSQGAPLLRKDVDRLYTKFKKEYDRDQDRFEKMPERSLGQEAYQMAHGMVVGMADITLRMAEGVTTDQDLHEMAREFTDGAVEFTAPMAASAVRSATSPLVMAKKSPIEHAMNLMMLRAPVVGKIRGKAAALERRVKSDGYRIAKELQRELGQARAMGPDLPQHIARYPKAWAEQHATAKRKRADVAQVAAQKAIKALDPIIDKAGKLNTLADIIDASGMLLGDVGFGFRGSGISTLSLVRTAYRRALSDKVGGAGLRWWLAPKDARLPRMMQALERESAASHNAGILRLQDAIHMVPKHLRPTIEEFMWMEHEPLFNANPALSLIKWVDDAHGGRWQLTRAGQERAGIQMGEAALYEQVAEAATNLFEQAEGRFFKKGATLAELEQVVPQTTNWDKLSPEQRAFRIQAGSKIAANNRYGRNLVRTVNTVTEEAIGLGMFADPLSLRQTYWANLYDKPSIAGAGIEKWRAWKERRARKGEVELSGSPDGGEFMRNKLRALEIPIEARLVELGRTIPDEIINKTKNEWIQIDEGLKGYAMDPPFRKQSGERWFNPQEFLKRRNDSGRGGFGLKQGLIQNASDGIGRLIWDVEMFKLYKKMDASGLVSDVSKPGYIFLEDKFLRGSKDTWKTMFSKMGMDELLGRARELGFDESRLERVGKGKLLRSALENDMSRHAPRKYGAIGGKFLQEDIWHEMVNTAKFADDAGKLFPQLIRKWKVGKTAWSPTTTARNVLTNVLLFAPMAEISILNPLNLKYYRQIISDLSKPEHKRSRHWREAFEDGVFDGTMHRTELGVKSTASTRFNNINWNQDKGAVARDLAWEMLNYTKDLSHGRTPGWQIPGHLYGVVDDVFRGAYHHKFKDTLGRTQARANARKFFIDYESVPGFVQLLRAPFNPMMHVKGAERWKKPGHGETIARESALGKSTFMIAGQPFLAFTARALPLLLDWMRDNPHKAQLYMNLHEWLTRLSMKESGISEDAVYASLASSPFWERMRYSPVTTLTSLLGIDKKRGVSVPTPRGVVEEYAYPTMDVAWMTPLDIFTGQLDQYTKEEGMVEMLDILDPEKRKETLGRKVVGFVDWASRVGFGNDPVSAPIFNLIRNEDPYEAGKIYNTSRPAWEQFAQMAGYLTRKLLPPVTPSPSDVYDLIAGDISPDLLDPKKRVLQEEGRFSGGTLYETMRASALKIPDLRGRILELSDAMYRLVGFKIRYHSPTELAVYNAKLAKSHIMNAMAGAKDNFGLGGVRDLATLEGPAGDAARKDIAQSARRFTVKLVARLTELDPDEASPATEELIAEANEFLSADDWDGNISADPDASFEKLSRLLAKIGTYSAAASDAVSEEIRRQSSPEYIEEEPEE